MLNRIWDFMCQRAAWQLKSGEFNLKRVPALLFALLILSVTMGTASDCNHHCLYCEPAPINVAFEKQEIKILTSAHHSLLFRTNQEVPSNASFPARACSEISTSPISDLLSFRPSSQVALPRAQSIITRQDEMLCELGTHHW